MFLYNHDRLRHYWLLIVDHISLWLRNLSSKLNMYHHESTAFYFMLAVGGEEEYKTLGQRLIEENDPWRRRKK